MTPGPLARGACCALLFVMTPRAAAAQQAPADTPASAIAPSPWRPLRVGKWLAAGATAGSALYGLIENQRADDEYEKLEALCVVDQQRCVARLPTGAYADAELEAQYQRMRAHDRRARTALVAGQVGVVTTVVLFILDLRNTRAPDNIPYEPRRFDAGRSSDGGLQLRMSLPVR